MSESNQSDAWHKVAGIVTDTPLVIPVGTYYEELWVRTGIDDVQTIGELSG